MTKGNRNNGWKATGLAMNLGLLIGLMVLFHPARAQRNKKDTLAPIRDFISVTTGYKQVPMYLKMEMVNRSNFISSGDDTATIRAEFFLQTDKAYVRFGDLEQIVNDSLALMVSNRDEAMVLFTDAAPVVRQMRDMMGQPAPDSSVRNLSYQYTGTITHSTKESNLIELSSRGMIRGSSLPKEVIRVEYDMTTRLPKQVETTRRTLIPLDETRYEELRKETSLSGSLLAMEGYYFLLREQVTAYRYLAIEKNNLVSVPVRVEDRVTRNGEGEYMPVKAYEHYLLTRND